MNTKNNIDIGNRGGGEAAAVMTAHGLDDLSSFVGVMPQASGKMLLQIKVNKGEMDDRKACLLNEHLYYDQNHRSVSVWGALMETNEITVIEPWRKIGDEYQITMWGGILSLKKARRLARGGIFSKMDVVVNFVGFKKMGQCILLNSKDVSVFWCRHKEDHKSHDRLLGEIAKLSDGLKKSERGCGYEFLSEAETPLGPNLAAIENDLGFSFPKQYDYVFQVTHQGEWSPSERFEEHLRENCLSIKPLERHYEKCHREWSSTRISVEAV
jgi:hypothetical protein